MKILMVEDDTQFAKVMQIVLSEAFKKEIHLKWVDQLSFALEQLAQESFDLILLDLGLPDSRGIDSFLKIHSQAPKTPIVVLTADQNNEHAIEAMKNGAQDYIVKGEASNDLIIRSIRYAVERQRILEELKQAKEHEKEFQELAQRKRMEETIRKLVEVSSAKFGKAFFESMTTQLSELLETDYTLIGELIKGPVESIETLAVYANGKIIDNFHYDLADTPCADVADQNICIYPSGVAELFAKDRLLKEMKVEAYVGIPLFDSLNQPIGILVAMFREPLTNPEFAKSILQIFGSRTGSEIERKQKEEALSESEERLRKISESAQEAIIMLDSQHQISYWNEAAERIFGFSKKEAIGENLATLIVPERCRKDHTRGLKRFMETGQGHLIGNLTELLALRKDGAEFPIELSLSGVKIKGKWNAIGIVRDISERKQGEKAIQQQAHRINLLNQITRAVAERAETEQILLIVLNRLEEHLPIDFGGFHTFDPNTETFLRAITGIKSSKRFKEQNGHEIVNASLKYSWFAPCLNGKSVYLSDTSEIDSLFTNKLAEQGVYSVNVTPLIHGQKTLGILITGRSQKDSFNHSERQFLEVLCEHVTIAVHQGQLYIDLQDTYNQLKQTQESMMKQERLRALGQMASGIVHDMNNSLSPVLGYTELLLSGNEQLSDTAKRYLTIIQTAAVDISHIISNMREFYRPRESDEGFLPIDLNQQIKSVVDLTQPKWKDIPQEKGLLIKIELDLEKGLPLLIGFDYEIREALTNLIINAVDAMPEGGDLCIRSSTTREHFIVEVTDTGIGMDIESLGHCLDPFFSTKGKSGTGLGLSMVFGIMQRHDGEIQLESELNKGVTARLLFPLKSSENKDTPLDIEDSKEKRIELKILCIDDESSITKLVRDMLEVEGHRVDTADGGQSGLDSFYDAINQGEPFDVVITDLGMPDMTGRDVAKKIKEKFPTTPIILLTGWGKRMDAEGNIPKEVDRILSKPPRLKELKKALREITQTISK